MQVEDLRAWHWIIVGLVAGLMFGLVRREAGPWFDTDDLPTLSAPVLEQLINNRAAPNPLRRMVAAFHPNQPVFKNLIVHPPVPGDPSGSNWITGKMYEIVSRLTDPANPHSPPAYYEEWEPFKCRATIPYKATVGAPGKYPDFMAYFAAIQKKANPQFTYRYAWWERPALVILMPTAAGLLIIGIAWPLSIRLMQGAGVARPRRTKSVRRPRSAAATAVAARDTTAGDLQLAALNDQLETSLAAGAAAHAPIDDSSSPNATPIAPLGGVPEPVSAAGSAAMDEASKEYGGEFYPVAKPGGSKHQT